jgi:hypothetical protein
MSALRKFSGSKGGAGAYKAIVFDELTASLRLVAELPPLAKWTSHDEEISQPTQKQPGEVRWTY